MKLKWKKMPEYCDGDYYLPIPEISHLFLSLSNHLSSQENENDKIMIEWCEEENQYLLNMMGYIYDFKSLEKAKKFAENKIKKELQKTISNLQKLVKSI